MTVSWDKRIRHQLRSQGRGLEMTVRGRRGPDKGKRHEAGMSPLKHLLCRPAAVLATFLEPFHEPPLTAC